jgi:predicted PurR-regulated permease PerM
MLIAECSPEANLKSSTTTWRDHARTTGTALKNWFVAQCYDSAAVALLWLVGLLIIGIPWAPLWAILAGILQFVPHVGGPLALVIPAILAAFSQDHMRFFYVLILFAVIMVTDGLFLQPYFMRRTAKVPFWAALLTPIAVVLLIPFWWAVLLAPPLLAVIFAFRRKYQSADLTTKDTKEHEGR